MAANFFRVQSTHRMRLYALSIRVQLVHGIFVVSYICSVDVCPVCDYYPYVSKWSRAWWYQAINLWIKKNTKIFRIWNLTKGGFAVVDITKRRRRFSIVKFHVCLDIFLQRRKYRNICFDLNVNHPIPLIELGWVGVGGADVTYNVT